MKKTVLNIILLASLLFVINQIVHAYFLPFTWGDEDLHAKMVHYKANKDDYTAIFIGGSLEYRHVNPEITDSICQQFGVDFRAFNAGGDGVAYLHQIRVLEEVLKEPSPNLKYAFHFVVEYYKIQIFKSSYQAICLLAATSGYGSCYPTYLGFKTSN
jgi:hypothetical protein